MPKNRVEIVISTEGGGSAEVIGEKDSTSSPPSQQNNAAAPADTTTTATKNDNDHADLDADDDDDDELQRPGALLRPYKKIDAAAPTANVAALKSVVATIQARGPTAFEVSDAEKKELADNVDNLKYTAMAESHWPDKPSVLSEVGAVAIAMEMLGCYRFVVVAHGFALLALATKHPLCAHDVLHKFTPPPAAVLEKSESAAAAISGEAQATVPATPAMQVLDYISAAMVKFKNKTDLQLDALDFILNLLAAPAADVSSENNSNNASSSSSSSASSLFLFNTVDIFRSAAISAVMNAAVEGAHDNSAVVAEKVVRVFQFAASHRPCLTGSQGQPGPSVADLFANVGEVLPIVLRLGGRFPTRPRIIGPICRLLALMCENSAEPLAASTAPSLLTRTLRHYADGKVPAIALDCIRALSRCAAHFLPLQLESLPLQLRNVMSSTANTAILTECIRTNMHVLRLAVYALERAEQEHVMQRDESVDPPSMSKKEDSHDCLSASPEDEQIHHAKRHMRKLLELMQTQTVPFVGAAYDHFADDDPVLAAAADAFLRELGDQIRRQFYGSSSG